MLPRPTACLVWSWLKPAGSNTVACSTERVFKHEVYPACAESGAGLGKRTLVWTWHRGEGSAMKFYVAKCCCVIVPNPLLCRFPSYVTRFMPVPLRGFEMFQVLQTFPKVMSWLFCGRFGTSWRRWATRPAVSHNSLGPRGLFPVLASSGPPQRQKQWKASCRVYSGSRYPDEVGRRCDHQSGSNSNWQRKRGPKWVVGKVRQRSQQVTCCCIS